MGAQHKNINICPPGTEHWGRVFQQLTEAGQLPLNVEPSKICISPLQFDSPVVCDTAGG